MPGVTREQIDRAKEWDLLSYLQTYEPGELTKKRPTDKEYRTKTHDSLVISNGRWNWTTRGFGGKTALDYLIKVRGMEFVEAVRTLNDGRAAPSLSQPVTRPPEQPRAFALPEGNRCATAAVSYLQRRGIDSEIISRCIRAGIFFESRKYHNCVFVGRDGGGQPVFASKRGTYDRNGPGFKGDVTGSNKDIAFRLPCDPGLDHVAVFEAPIDLMSFCTLHRQMRSNAVALCGLYRGPLDNYLRENPHLKQIVLCLDADGPGQEAAEKFLDEYTQEGYAVSIQIPAQGKDWNEYLLRRGSEERRRKNGER